MTGNAFLCCLNLVMCLCLSSALGEVFRGTETCLNKFCPPGTYCQSRDVVKCTKSPCRPILMCLPDSKNGCKGLQCPEGMECVERPLNGQCSDNECKRAAKCVRPGTCDAVDCPLRTHRCVEEPDPHCVRGIFTISDVGAKLAQRQQTH